jgi:uncharacterized protein YndB with AHSA1/START domain
MSDGRFPYEIVSRWRVAGTIEEVYGVLTDAAAMPGWWPEAYTRVSEVAPGEPDGCGRVSDIVTRGFLPYDVNWRLTVVAVEPPTMIRVAATGDLSGEGEWRLDQDGAAVALAYTWRVRVEKPLMERLEFLLKPLFTVNHYHVMRRGEAGLKRELARRQGASDDDRDRAQGC